MHATPEAQRVAVLYNMPLTPCLRTAEPVAVYLHAPHRYLAGPWTQVPSDRVTCRIQKGALVVAME